MLFRKSPQLNKEFLKDIQKQNLNVGGVPLSLYAKELLIKMLEIDPSKRLKWIEIYDHPLIK